MTKPRILITNDDGRKQATFLKSYYERLGFVEDESRNEVISIKRKAKTGECGCRSGD